MRALLPGNCLLALPGMHGIPLNTPRTIRTRSVPREVISPGGLKNWFLLLMPNILFLTHLFLPAFKRFTYFGADRYTVVDAREYFSLFYLRNMRLYVLKRVPPPYQQTAESPFYEFLGNSNGAHIQSGGTFRCNQRNFRLLSVE